MRHTVTWLSPHPGETIAYSGHCEQDQHGRPIAAHFNWSPQHLPEAADRWSTHYLVRVAMHELTHALVFSAPLLDHFPGVGGSHCPLVTTPASRWRVTTPRTHVTPPLTCQAPSRPWPPRAAERPWRYARRTCSEPRARTSAARDCKVRIKTCGCRIAAWPATLCIVQAATLRVQAATLRVQAATHASRLQACVRPGAQLEDGGVAGTAGCHWEMRWFRDEYMTGSASPSDRARSPQYIPTRPSPHDPSMTPSPLLCTW